MRDLRIHIVPVWPVSTAVREQLVAMHRDCFSTTHGKLFDTGYWWIAYRDKEPVGFAGMHRSNRWTDVGYLSRAGVVEQYRGLGLQRRLIGVRVLKAKSLGWTCCITDTTENPHSANNLINKGFRMYEPRHPWGGDTTCYWKKDLK